MNVEIHDPCICFGQSTSVFALVPVLTRIIALIFVNLVFSHTFFFLRFIVHGLIDVTRVSIKIVCKTINKI